MTDGSNRLSYADMVEGLGKMVASKTDWLATFSSGPKKRPDGDLEIQRKHLTVLQQAADDYQRAADRPAAQGARG